MTASSTCQPATEPARGTRFTTDSTTDDDADDFTLLRTRALIKVRVPLPSRVRLTDDPLATHVTLSRRSRR